MPQMAVEGEVVVLEKARFYTLDRAGTRTYAARVLPLGVTAYGPTREKAFKKAQRMVAGLVAVHRSQGNLEDWLHTSGANWCWAKAYQGQLPVQRVGDNQQNGHEEGDGEPSWVSISDLGPRVLQLAA